MRQIIIIAFLFVCLYSYGQDTTFSTYSISHDTTISTTIPVRYICRDTAIQVLDTPHNSLYNSGLYIVVGGSTFITQRLCDTIPAHDSSFITKTTHDTTKLIITLRPLTVRYNSYGKLFGQTFSFPHTGAQLSVISGSLKPGDIITSDNAASAGSASNAAAGAYPITFSPVVIFNGATNVSGGYNITYQNGTLTVAPQLTLTITANNQSKVQGSTFTFLGNGSQVSITGGALQPGDVISADNAASAAAGSGATPGSYPITLTSVTIMNGGSNVTINYSISYVNGFFTVGATAQNPTISYGAMVLTSDKYPTFESRMVHCHYLGVPVFRYNWDYGDDRYRTDQIMDDGLRVALTFNHKRNQTLPYFPRGTTEINFYASKLDSLLKLPDKPDVVSINNEEGHREYWKGTPYDYLIWFEACVKVAHNNGVPISNGGITHGIVYSLRKWYADRGLQDSVDFVNEKFLLGGSTTSYIQEQLDWYEPLLAGFAASEMDYVNLHWYEYPRQQTQLNETSKLLPLLINMIRVRTGKDVLTTETGTHNYHIPLLWEMFNEWRASGCRYVIYFAGEKSEAGGLATDLSDAYRAWLLQ